MNMGEGGSGSSSDLSLLAPFAKRCFTVKKMRMLVPKIEDAVFLQHDRLPDQF